MKTVKLEENRKRITSLNGNVRIVALDARFFFSILSVSMKDLAVATQMSQVYSLIII